MDAADIVHLEGLIKNGTNAATIFTLPLGFRPPADLIFTAQAASGFARVDVYATGVVMTNGYFAGGTNAYVSLSGISFRVN